MAERPNLDGYRKGPTQPPAPTVPDLVERDPVDPPHAVDDDAREQFNTRLTKRHRRMIEELLKAHPYGRRATRRDVVEEAIEAAHRTRFGEPPVR